MENQITQLKESRIIDKFLKYAWNFGSVKIGKFYAPECLTATHCPNHLADKFTDYSEEMSKNIFDSCNLTWSKDILQFYERKDLFTKTLSFNQIRSKISKYNNDKY